MRYVTLALALGFGVGATSAALACEGLKTVSTTPQQIVASDQAPSTPIQIPVPGADG